MVSVAVGSTLQTDNVIPLTAMEILHQRIMGLLEGSEYDPTRIFYPAIVPEEVARQIVSALLSGNNINLYGPPGTGKSLTCTVIRNRIFGFPERWVVSYQALTERDVAISRTHTTSEGKKIDIKGVCPVGCHPASLYDPQYRRKVEPCPVCKIEYSGGVLEELGDFPIISPDKVHAMKIHIRDGYGTKRIQCSPETTPEKLVGRLNIQKYLHDPEGGDPSDPRIFDPGDLLQTFLICHEDELSKLPLASQQTILQATQEREVNPSGVRMPFPRKAIDIATSNEEDMSRMLKPLNDRFLNIYYPYEDNGEKNGMGPEEILKLGLFHEEEAMFVKPKPVDLTLGPKWVGRPILRHGIIPTYLEETIIEAIRQYRNQEIWKKVREAGSHRVMIDTALNAISYSIVRTKGPLAIARYTDILWAFQLAIQGRIRGYENELNEYKSKMLEAIERINIPAIAMEKLKNYVCQFVFKVRGTKAKKALEQLEPLVRHPETLKVITDIDLVDRAKILKHVSARDNLFIEYVLTTQEFPPTLNRKQRLTIETNLVASILSDLFANQLLDTLCE